MGNSFLQEYERKLVHPDEAVKIVKSGDHIFYGEFAMFPELLDEALAKRAAELSDIIVRGISFTKVPKIVLEDLKREHFTLQDWHCGVVGRKLGEKQLAVYIPITYHQGPRIINKYQKVDAAIIMVGPMDENGYFNLGPVNSVTPVYTDKAEVVMVEVNHSVPKCLGGNGESIHISQVDYIVEGKNTPLIELPPIQAQVDSLTSFLGPLTPMEGKG